LTKAGKPDGRTKEGKAEIERLSTAQSENNR
jgi:hypothetical protein